MKNMKKLAQWALRALCALLIIVLADQGLGVQSVANRIGIALALVVVSLIGIFADKVINEFIDKFHIIGR